MKEILPTREQINKRYATAIQFLIDNFTLKNQREFSARMDEKPIIFTQIKTGNRNASINQITKVINDFNLNANYFFKQDNEKEAIVYGETVISPSITGNNRDVTVGKTISKNTGNIEGTYYNNVEKLVNQASPEIKEHINDIYKKYEKLEQEKLSLQDELNEVKKTNTFLQNQLQECQSSNKEKEERLYKSQCEMIELLKKQKD